jgi:hypothetical protein
MREWSPRIVVISLVALAAACSQSSSLPAPAAPTPTATASPGNGLPEPTAGPYSISGSVVERAPQGTRALPEAAVNLWVDAGRYGYSYWWANGQVHSDAAGNFRLPNLIAATGFLQAFKTGYIQQCALPAISLSTNTTNLHLILVARGNAWVDVSSVPASMPGRIVAGRIVENTAAGPQPVAGAFVSFEPVPDFPAASTYSDANGRYLLCGVSEGGLGVELGDRMTYTSAPRPLVVSDYDIVLP